MNETFRQHVEQLHAKFEALMAMTPVAFTALPKSADQSGIYLLTEGDQHLYIGRSRKIRSRLRMHVGHYAGASFAVKLARHATGRPSSYSTKDSVKELLKDPAFSAAFDAAKKRIREMRIRYVEEPDSYRQALLEIYATLALGTRYNDFDTH